MHLHKHGSAVRTEVIDDVLLIEINNPPINNGSQAVRSGERQQDRSLMENELQKLAATSGHGFTVADLSPVLNV